MSDADKLDAARYRWLRAQHWNDNTLAVVYIPKNAVKLGYDCPMGKRLDEFIDDEMSKITKPDTFSSITPINAQDYYDK